MAANGPCGCWGMLPAPSTYTSHSNSKSHADHYQQQVSVAVGEPMKTNYTTCRCNAANHSACMCHPAIQVSASAHLAMAARVSNCCSHTTPGTRRHRIISSTAWAQPAAAAELMKALAGTPLRCSAASPFAQQRSNPSTHSWARQHPCLRLP